MPANSEPDDPDLMAWRDIVEHYGDRAELPPEVGIEVEPREPVAEPGSSYGARFGEFDDDVDEPFEPSGDPLDEGFVPPDPEPFHLGTARTVAWAGVLGAPVLALIATVVVTSSDVSVPSWFGWLLVAAFLGGFGYLVVTMPKDRDDPWDDGARL
ncbi:hypothetical protein JCM18899A_17180 [Nocardioides sp. AN3]